MNCEDAAERIWERIDGGLCRADEESLAAHVGGCPRCRELAKRAASLHALLPKALAAPAAPDLAPGVLSALRTSPPDAATGWAWAAAAATAAVLAEAGRWAGWKPAMSWSFPAGGFDLWAEWLDLARSCERLAKAIMTLPAEGARVPGAWVAVAAGLAAALWAACGFEEIQVEIDGIISRRDSNGK